MVKVEEVEQLMKEVFPTCPICNADKGYDVSGWFKTYVQCNECGAKWDNSDFVNLKLEKLMLKEPARDGRGSNLKYFLRPIGYWQSLSEEELKKSRQELETNQIKWKKIEEWEKIEEEVAKGKIKAPYPKKICSDCKNVIEKFGNLEELANIASCPRCDSDNLKIIKSKFDEWYERYIWLKVIVWVLGIPLVVIYYLWNYAWLIIILFPVIVAVILFIQWFIENALYIIGVVAVVVLAAVFLWRREKLKVWLIFKKIGILGTVLIVYFAILMSSLFWNPKFFDTPLGLPFRILALVLLPIGVSILVVGIIGFGWGHPKGYVKVYATLCGIWESYVGIVTFFQLDTFIDPMEIIEFSIYFIPPLIPLWYLKRKEEEQKRKEAVAWELEDQLKELDEQLSLGHITQEEYEQKKKKLLEKSEPR